MSSGKEYDQPLTCSLEHIKCKLFGLKMNNDVVFMPMNKNV